MTRMITISTVLWALAAAALGQGGDLGGFGGQGGAQGGFGGQGGGQGGFAGQQQQQGPQGGLGGGDFGKYRGARGTGMGGGMGGQGLGGGQGMGQGPLSLGDSIRQTEEGIQRYLNGDETKSILTPGEYVEWKLELKANQVVISEARSDAFDPAIEIVDDKGKVLASNDDRYPGDQRPLLLWRCEHDGNYMLHIRCFHDKSGGQVFSRIRIFDSYLVTPGDKSEFEIHQQGFLLRVPMKAGQYKKLVADFGTQRNYMGFNAQTVISPIGLPDINLAQSMGLINGQAAILAPVSGDYYIFTEAYTGGQTSRIKVGTQEIVPMKLDRVNGFAEVGAATGTDAIWEITAKKGELVKVVGTGLYPNSQFIVAERPDVSKYDLSKPETNPFYPHATKPEDAGPTFTLLPGKARDGRVLVFFAQKDTKYWIATDAQGPAKKQFTLTVKPAAAELLDDKTNAAKLKIGDNDYWSFDAKAGDVMTLKTEATGFAETIFVREPDLNLQSSFGLGTDETKLNWQMIVQKPGRYFVTVACYGDGGMGDYTLSRKVVHAKEFAYGQPAKGEISAGQTQIWKFTATPDRPLLVHWNASNWDFGSSIMDEKGQTVGFQRDMIDGHNQYGILKVDKPRTFVIVLTGNGTKSDYLIELQGLGAKK